VPIGLLASSLAAILPAGWLVGVGLRRRRSAHPMEAWRLLTALSVVTWGVGHLMLAVASRDRPLHFPELGDFAPLVGVPLVVVGLVRFPRATRAGTAGLRLLMDAALLSASGLLVTWELLVRPQLGNASTSASVTALVWLVPDVLVLAIVGLSVLREPGFGDLPALLATALYGVGEAWFTVASISGPRQLPAGAAAAWCLAWPVITYTMATVVPGAPGRAIDADGADRREARSGTGGVWVSMLLVTVALVGSGWLDGRTRTDLLGGVLVGAICLICAVREGVGMGLRLQLIRSLRAQAFQEPLTGLANRRALTNAIAAVGPGQSRTVVTVDLDGFKNVNEVLGHDVGDRILVEVARRLQAGCPPSGLVARIGGDEFAVLVPGGLADGTVVAENLIAGLHRLLAELGQGLALSASAGVGRLVRDDQAEEGQDRLTALVESAAALHAAKQGGRNQVAVYSPALAQARERLAQVERRLTDAVDQGRITVAVQPLVRLSDGSTSGIEALARWTDAELGPVGPDEFIPVAEQSGLIVALGAHVLRRAVADATAFGILGAGVRLAVNVSPIQLRVPAFVGLVQAVLDEYAVDPQLLVLELTEAILVAEDHDTAHALTRLKDLGVRLAIDDFGSGYSALSYLRRLPVDEVKIDRTWTVATLDDGRTRSIVASVNALAHRLGAHVVMEGIEDAATAAMCVELGADLGQGWHFGRPQQFAALAQELRLVGASGPPSSAAGPPTATS